MTMPLSRREWIAAVLGIPVLVSGCVPDQTLPPAGELLGQSWQIGHRLRDGYRPKPADDGWREVEVVIVGGGVAGLTAARRLQQSGCTSYVVLEMESAIGGTARSGRSPVSAFPWGAHYVPVPLAENRELIKLFQEMEIVESIADDGSPKIAEQYLSRDPTERLWIEGQWIEGLYPSLGATDDDLAELAAFHQEIERWSEWRDSNGRRAFSIPISQSSKDPAVTHLDQISMADWLKQKGWASERLKWFIDYSCRDDYGMTSNDSSAWAALLYYAARLKDSKSEPQPFITWPEGNGRIVNFLAEGAGSRIQSGMAVTQIQPIKNEMGDCVDVICVEAASGKIAGFHARHVICAIPQFIASRVIDGFVERTGRKLDQFEYGTWFVANLELKTRLKEKSFPLCWDNVIYDSRSLGYVVATHQSGRDDGPTVLTWYYPMIGPSSKEQREQLMKASWADLADLVFSDLERPHPEIRKLTTRMDIFRWGHAMIRPKPGFLTSPQRIEAIKPDGRIHFANTDLSGVALFEEAFDHGIRAADEVLAEWKSNPV